MSGVGLAFIHCICLSFCLLISLLVSLYDEDLCRIIEQMVSRSNCLQTSRFSALVTFSHSVGPQLLCCHLRSFFSLQCFSFCLSVRLSVSLCVSLSVCSFACPSVYGHTVTNSRRFCSLFYEVFRCQLTMDSIMWLDTFSPCLPLRNSF